MLLLIIYASFLSLLIICLLGCSDKNCDVDTLFKQRFDNCISLIKKSEDEEWVNAGEIRNAFIFLTVISGHRTKVNDPENPSYENKTDFKQDLLLWNQWYESNKCSITLKKADSLFIAYKKRDYKIKNFNW